MSGTNRFRSLPAHDGSGFLIEVWQVPTAAIQYLTAHVEASDGIGLVRTLDESRGIIECWVMPDFASEFSALMRALAHEWPMQQLDREFE